MKISTSLWNKNEYANTSPSKYKTFASQNADCLEYAEAWVKYDRPEILEFIIFELVKAENLKIWKVIFSLW